MALHFARERVQVAGTRVRRQSRPRGRGGVGCVNRGIDVRLAPLRHARQHRRRGGIDRLEVLAFGGSGPLAIDEMAETAAVVLLDPVERGRVALGGRPVLHRFEQRGDGGHLYHGVTVGGSIAPRHEVLELAFDVGQQGACAQAE